MYCPKGDRKSRGNFLEKTIFNISAALEEAIFTEEAAASKGLLQTLDSRSKLLILAAFLLAVNLSANLAVIVILYLLTLPLAIASALSIGHFLKRVWLVIPLFSGLVALPAIFSAFTPGAAVLVLVNSGGFYLAITTSGLLVVATLVMRVAASVSAVALLILTTPWTELLKGLRWFWTPKMFILILGMTYRYIHLLLRVAQNMLLARKSRVVGKLRGVESRRLVGSGVGALLGKSYNLSEEVYLAMVSRGFDGEVRTLERLRWRWADSLFVVGCLALLGLVIRGGGL